MACCAFIAFVIGQCLAAFQSWRNRVLRLLGMTRVETKPLSAPRWRKALLAAVVVELGLVAGVAIGAGLAQGEGAWSALCSASVALAAR